MLRARALTKKYGDQTALDGLELYIGPGEIFCLLGANGAGKTTTINLFLDFIRPTSGEASINGLVVADNGLKTRRLTAYIPERVSLYENLSGRENLAYFSELASIPLSTERQYELLDEAGLDRQAADNRLSTYSKGMRQKVAIATAIARQARVLLLDEPTSGLDPRAASDLASLLKQLSTRGTAILMATHDIFRARDIATRVGIMKSGRLLAQIDPTTISSEDLEQIYLQHMSDEGR